MWTVHSKAGEHGIRITKANIVDASTRYWLRPGKEYVASRSETADFQLTHKRHSRKDAAFTIIASVVDRNKMQVTGFQDSVVPPYTLEIRAGLKPVFVVRAGQGHVEIPPGEHVVINDGMIVKTLSDVDSFIYFDFCPVSIYNRSVKKRQLHTFLDQIASLGIMYSTHLSDTEGNKALPSSGHTHYIVHTLAKDPTAMTAQAAANALSIVNEVWFNALLTSADHNEGRSKLEEDFEGNWPDEKDYFPPVDDKANNAEEKLLYAPDNRRRHLFNDTLLLDFSQDPNIPPTYRSAGGLVCSPPLSSDASLTEFVTKYRQQNDLRQSMAVYAMFPLAPDQLSDLEQQALHQGCIRVGSPPYIYWKDIIEALIHVKPLREIIGQSAVLDITRTQSRSPPTASAITATADITVPATNPSDAPLQAPAKPQFKNPVQADAPAASSSRLSNKPRKLGERAAYDPFGDIFKEDDDVPAFRPPLRESRAETQLVSSLAADAFGESIAPFTSKPFAAVPRLNSKYAGLKRRAGAASGSQLTFLDEPALNEDDLDLPPLKKIRSFDPDVESAMSQAATKRRERQQQKALSNITETGEQSDDNNLDASKRAAANDKKRKLAPFSLSSDDEPQGSRKKIMHKSTGTAATATSLKASVMQDQESYKPEEERYLQVKAGRKRVTKEEAGFNEDFNKLKIQRPLLPVAKKMGWNERDILQEELEEEDDGFLGADDNATFFQIKYVPMTRKKAVIPSVTIDPKYVGKPNFKAFRPKNVLHGLRNAAAQEKRENVKLVLNEPPGYGLKESYGTDKDKSDPDEGIELPTANTQKNFAPKVKSKMASGPPLKKAIPGRRNRIIQESDNDEVDEMDDDRQSVRSSTVQEDSRPPPNGSKTRAKEPITLGSDSSDDGGKRFAGFQRKASSYRH